MAHRTKGGRLTAAIRRDFADVKAGTADEYAFQRVIVAYARDHGWLVHHTPRVRPRPGKAITPTIGHIGFPDLTLVRDGAPGEAVFVELKAERGTVRPEQQIWIAWLRAAGLEVVVWRPSQWRTAFDRLR